MVGFDVMSHVALSESCWKHAGVCGSLKNYGQVVWPPGAASVSVLAWMFLSSRGVTTPHQRRERSRDVRSGVHAGAGRWELVKKHYGAFLWCALVCAPSPVWASPVRIRIRLLNEGRARAESRTET